MNREQFARQAEVSQRALRRFLVALCCGDAALADDIAQEAFIKAYMSLDSLADDSRFDAWLRRIAYNTFVNMRRSATPPGAAYSEAGHISPPESADSSFHYEALYQALDRIPDKERTSILLFYIDGYSTKEISRIIDSSEEAVRQHLTRGRKHLHSLLQSR